MCKIFDEKEARPNNDFRVQRNDEEKPEQLVVRLNTIYKETEARYLALPFPSENVAFDPARIPLGKIAFVVEQIESVSFTEIRYGDGNSDDCAEGDGDHRNCWHRDKPVSRQGLHGHCGEENAD